MNRRQLGLVLLAASVLLVALAIVGGAGAVWGPTWIRQWRDWRQPKPRPVVIEGDAAQAKSLLVQYARDLADAFDEEAKSPAKTVREAADRVRARDDVARGKLKAGLSKVMAPRIGAEDLDPAAAKALFDELARGLRAVQ